MQTAQFLEAPFRNAGALDLGLLIARLVFGLILSAHGAQKLFGWFGGYSLTATGGFFEQLGFRPGRVFAAIAVLTEIVAGLLITFGLLGPVGPALMVSVIIVAAVAVHWTHGFFATTNDIELPLLYATVAIVLALTGPGLFSLDALLGLEALWSSAFAAAALAVGVIGGIGNLAARRRVCGRMIARADAVGRVTYESEEVYFCSDDCRRTLQPEPERFVPERHEPPYTVQGGFAAPKFGAAGSGGLEYEPTPERHEEKPSQRKK
jgi:putative oxidoreductase